MSEKRCFYGLAFCHCALPFLGVLIKVLGGAAPGIGFPSSVRCPDSHIARRRFASLSAASVRRRTTDFSLFRMARWRANSSAKPCSAARAASDTAFFAAVSSLIAAEASSDLGYTSSRYNYTNAITEHHAPSCRDRAPTAPPFARRGASSPPSSADYHRRIIDGYRLLSTHYRRLIDYYRRIIDPYQFIIDA